MQVFTVPLEERRFKEMNEHKFGDESEQAKICKDIMQKTGVVIFVHVFVYSYHYHFSREDFE